MKGECNGERGAGVQWREDGIRIKTEEERGI